jgi:phosphatidylserine/phosphatidylglycerophosphate/cardiolipin synthase-like enzyme
MAPPGHPPHDDGASIHDLYVEIRGPAATDVHHNFVQRWNEASERARPDGCWPDAAAADDLPFPARATEPAGMVPVQITRTVRAGCYRTGVAAPGAAPYAIAAGERSVVEQYLAAIDAARKAVYVENQFLASPEVLERLEAAVHRGVEVVVLVPGEPMPELRAARQDPRAEPFYARLAALGRHPRFTLAGLAGNVGPGRYHDVYVHAKAMLVDDAWGTIGSTNVIGRSFHADTELNASFWDAATVRALRCRLLAEHLGADTGGLDAAAALRHFREVATANRERRARGETLGALAVALDPAAYGR